MDRRLKKMLLVSMFILCFLSFRNLHLLVKKASTMLFKCLFIGGSCDKIHIVNVPSLPGVLVSLSHEHLDVFLWLPAVPYMCHSFVDLSACRLTVPQTAVEAPAQERVEFTFVYYDQVTYFGSYIQRHTHCECLLEYHSRQGSPAQYSY